MSAKADEYNSLAARCQGFAADAEELFFKREFEQLAEQWKALAKDQEMQSSEIRAPASP
jgi:hypothetical protein